MSVRNLKNAIDELAQGEPIYINAINLSENAIDLLKDQIKAGVIKPDKKTLGKWVLDEENQPPYMKGKKIIPQMVYIKQ